MKVEISHVVENGNHEKERLVLKVKSSTDIGDYILMQTGYNDESVTTNVKNTFWFPYKEVETQDLVVVYTRKGKASSKKLKNGNTAHFFYWGIKKSIWDNEDRAPVLLFAPDWTSEAPENL